MVEIPRSALKTVFKQIPLLAGFRLEDFQIKPLPGFTNQNFHLKNNQYDWVLRIPKQETNLYINRQYESHNADLAYRLGIAPDCIWRDNSGLSLSVTLLNSRAINIKDLNNKAVLSDLLKTILRLHKAKFKFRGAVDLGRLLFRYYQLVPEPRQRLIESSYILALKKAELLSSDKTPLSPSHNDLILENILINNAKQTWIIDWEYASMATPYWDLATLCNAAKFSHAECNWTLNEYRGLGLNLDAEILTDYRFVLKVLSKCWMAAFTEIEPGDVN